MMENEYWQRRLTPFDWELCKMVRSLTNRTCEPKNGDDRYFIVVDYSENPEPDFIAAVMDAIAGRLGKRFAYMTDNPDDKNFIVYVNFSDDEYPGMIYAPDEKPGIPETGRIYCPILAEIRAIQVRPDRAKELFDFVEQKRTKG